MSAKPYRIRVTRPKSMSYATWMVAVDAGCQSKYSDDFDECSGMWTYTRQGDTAWISVAPWFWRWRKSTNAAKMRPVAQLIEARRHPVHDVVRRDFDSYGA